jgi:putative zinc finger/helix-turn-helix YgiT family protein
MTETESHFERQTCPRCEKGPITSRPHDERLPFGEGDDQVLLTATVPLRRCETCGLEYFDDEAEVARHRAVCAHLGVMEPERIRALRERYGLSRAAFARLTGLGEATLARWEHGSLIQNVANDRFLRLLEVAENFARLVSFQERDVSEASTSVQFRALEVSDEDLRKRASFQLRKAS